MPTTNTDGTIAPPVNPCSTRNAIIDSMFHAKPHSTLDTVNSAGRHREQPARRHRLPEKRGERNHHEFRHQIGRLHPADLVRSGRQAGLHVVQRRRDDLNVEQRHELAERHHAEDQELARVRQRRGIDHRAALSRLNRTCHESSALAIHDHHITDRHITLLASTDPPITSNEDMPNECSCRYTRSGTGDHATVAATAPQPSARSPTSERSAVVAAVAALAVALARRRIHRSCRRSTESTDNAYVGADATSVAPKVRGLVAAVLVQDNQRVRAGDPLVRIDAEEFDARVATATADLADADAGVAAARAALVSLDAEEHSRSANVRAAQSSIRAAQRTSRSRGRGSPTLRRTRRNAVPCRCTTRRRFAQLRSAPNRTSFAR